MLLSVLKIVGLVLSTVSGVIAALKETKTPDKTHLTPAGKALLTLGILGFAIALGAQLKEWQISRAAEREAREQNGKLLVEIRRAVTKFDTISMDLNCGWPMTDRDFTRYSQRITRSIRRIRERQPNLDVLQVAFGLEVISRTVDHISLFSAVPGSSGFPIKNDLAAAWYYEAASRPHIALFKRHFHPQNFDSFDEVRPNSNFADLVMIPSVGREELIFDPAEDARLFANYSQTGMNIPPETWAPSGSIRSVEDLSEVTAVIYLPFGGDTVQRIWTENPPEITLYFNHQRFSIRSTDLKPQKANGQTIFVYTFPKQSTS